jgi:hypothetical protein
VSKPYLEADFSTQITEDRSWRIREISDLKSAIARADDNLRRVLLRALITICYAHWEGYVRFAARKYSDLPRGSTSSMWHSGGSRTATSIANF